MFSKYSLSGYELTLAAVNSLYSSTTQYVLFLAREDLKKLRVLVEETNGTFAIKKQHLLNNGMYIVTDLAVQKSIDEAAMKDFVQELNGFERVSVFTNGTFNVGKYANDTSLITYTQSTQTKLNDLQTKAFLTNSQPC
jgi:hypothetical protein